MKVIDRALCMNKVLITCSVSIFRCPGTSICNKHTHLSCFAAIHRRNSQLTARQNIRQVHRKVKSAILHSEKNIHVK